MVKEEISFYVLKLDPNSEEYLYRVEHIEAFNLQILQTKCIQDAYRIPCWYDRSRILKNTQKFYPNAQFYLVKATFVVELNV